MEKEKIYWFVEQLDHVGGTEMVTLSDIDLLKDDYDITIVLDGERKKEVAFKLPEGVKIVSLNIPSRYMDVERNIEKYLSHFRYISFVLYMIYYVFYGFFSRFYFRKKIKKMTEKDSLLIAASPISRAIMPRGRTVYFHYHFNAERLLSPEEWFPRRLERKPDKYIFITQASLKKAETIREFRKIPKAMVYNLSRYTKYENYSYKGGKIIFIGRLVGQKRPQLLVQSAQILKNDHIPFTLDIIGDGPLKDELQSLIAKNNLENEVRLLGPINDPLENIRSADLAVFTSSYEGYLLVTGEANSQSVPVISSNWGAGVKEVVEDGVSGFIIDSSDPKAYASKVEELLNDKEKLLALKKSSYEYFVKSHSKEAVKEAWKKILG
ncbi:MAG: glycosyltransferase [Bacilli bacterium]|jgi:glycosyltransferase involved in cell wall biosynthesis|nr:glycosyltransferase [Bacilli bacterium]